MAEGDKSLGEEHRVRWSMREARLKARGKKYYDDPIRPREPVNDKRGTCPWCGGEQAQIVILQDDPHFKHAKAGQVHDSPFVGEHVGDAKARVCLTCGRVELTDSKPEGDTTHA